MVKVPANINAEVLRDYHNRIANGKVYQVGKLTPAGMGIPTHQGTKLIHKAHNELENEQMSENTMNITQAIPALKAYLDADIPVFVWGPPGVGKSDMVREIATDANRKLIDFRAVQLDPVDLRGIPHVADGVTQWAIPDFLPQAKRDGAEGFLFIDELNAAPQSVQAALYQLILDRRLGDYILPDGWRIVAAGNRQKDRAAATRMPTALANRFAHLEIEPDVETWINWANNANIDPVVCAFLRFRPEALFVMDESARAFPTPRSWAQVSKVSGIQDFSILHSLVAGLVGPGSAAEFCGFLKMFRQLPPIKEMIERPSQFDVAADPSARFALAMAVGREATPQNFDKILTCLGRLPAEYMVNGIRDAIARDPSLTETKAYIDYATSNQDVYL